MSKSVASLKVEDFEPHNGESFRLTAAGAQLELRLTEVRRLGSTPREGGAFSLTFLSAAGPFVPQGTYPIEHTALGAHQLFIVPLGPKDGGNCYEVIFT